MQTERNYGGEFLISEANRTRSREQITIGESQDLEAGAVLGRTNLGDPTVAAAVPSGTNTGNGVFGTPTADAGAPAGDYRVMFIEPNTNLGAFQVFKPNGQLDTPGHGVVGTAYNGTINFTIADGGTDFVAGDEFKVGVSYADGDGSYVAVDPTAHDGTEVAVAILWDKAVTGSGETVQAAAIVRDAEVDLARLGFGSLNDSQKTAAVAQLAAVGIIVRS